LTARLAKSPHFPQGGENNFEDIEDIDPVIEKVISGDLISFLYTGNTSSKSSKTPPSCGQG